MSTTTTPTPKKPPAVSSTAAANPTPTRSPSRTAMQSTSTMNSTANSANRAKPIRNVSSTPVSARAAAVARKPATNDAEDDAKAELQARLDELQERLQQAESTSRESRKHAEVLQIKLDEALKEQGMLEESVHEHTERIEEMEMEKRESLRARREFEQIYEAERVQSMREREEAALQKEELAQNMQRLKEALTSRELRDRAGIDDERRPSVSRTSSLRSEDPSSPSAESRLDRQFAPPSSLQRSDSRSSSRLVLQKDKLIESLRLELAEAQIKLVELENRGGGTLHQLEKDMYDIKMQNARLMEENESFQLLLSEKTLNGDLAQLDLLRPPSHSESQSRPSSSARNKPRHSLADELDEFEGEEETSLGESPADNRTKALRAEVNSLKDQNKALTLYINNIISRLLQHEQFEAILDKTPELMAGPGAISRAHAAAVELEKEKEISKEKELPPPPPPLHQATSEDDMQPTGFLQRAGSVLRRKPARPTSQLGLPTTTAPRRSMDSSESAPPNVYSDPSTAPSIPLGRSASTRGGHRRSRSDWPAASVVTNMYKGPSPGSQGPMSPGLAPTGRAGYFASQPRVISGGTIPTISDLEREKENQHLQLQPQQQQLHRDSKVSPSSLSTSPEAGLSTRNPNRSSVMSIPGASELGDFAPSSGPEFTGPASPPRSTTSSGERDTRPGAAVMMGSKPRPLRLVQEADEDRARKQANRASWFGGWGQAGTSFGGYLAGRTASNESGQQQQGQQQQ